MSPEVEVFLSESIKAIKKHPSGRSLMLSQLVTSCGKFAEVYRTWLHLESCSGVPKSTLLEAMDAVTYEAVAFCGWTMMFDMAKFSLPEVVLTKPEKSMYRLYEYVLHVALWAVNQLEQEEA